MEKAFSVMEIAAYYFPNYHLDARNEARHGRGWTEWELMKCARPRFERHDQPKIPLWGFEDEADPAVMAKKIAAAVKYGIDAFVFDWYWYDGPFLQRALDEGFLGAENCREMKFALMWANHDWMDRHPVGRQDAFHPPLLYSWTATRQNVAEVWQYLIDNYLTKPNYWKVGGLPYFSIYAVDRFIKQMGGPGEAAAVLAEFRGLARKAGLPGIHINAIWFDNLETTRSLACPPSEWVTKIGFSSYTSYNNVFTTPVWRKSFPRISCAEACREYHELADRAMKKLPAPYFPVVTAGWDSSPRTVQSEIYEFLDVYPYFPVMEPDPAALENAIVDLNALGPEAVFINAWNEWTEGSYIEPDEKNGFALLEAVSKAKKIISEKEGAA